jgi:hypothetical protein
VTGVTSSDQDDVRPTSPDGFMPPLGGWGAGKVRSIAGVEAAGFLRKRCHVAAHYGSQM